MAYGGYLSRIWPWSAVRLGKDSPHGKGIGCRLLSVSNVDIPFEIGGVRYAAFGNIPFEPSVELPSEPSLVTVISSPKSSSINRAWLSNYLDKLDECDVYKKALFLTGVIFTNVKSKHLIPTDCQRLLEDLGTEWWETDIKDSGALSLRPGPYVFINNVLKNVCRVYDDDHGAFLTALKPRLGTAGSGEFLQLNAAGRSYGRLGIAVLPRTPSIITQSPQQLRVAVKDCYTLQGLKTSLCNRAYYELSDPAASTADVVPSLIRDGAQILGLTKLSSMIAREEPMDAVEFHTVFNPRGDGYQSPAGSSSGSAASVAAYDWLDCSVGTDTSGSGRRPAMVNGVWEFRPSHDLISLDGLIRTYSLFDTPCVFARSFSIVKRVIKTWISTSPAASQGYEIIYPVDYLPVGNQSQMQIFNGFIDDMEALLPAKITQFSIRDSWAKSHPSDTPNDVDEYLEDVVAQTFYHQFYHSTDAFREEYSRRHDGGFPYVTPFVQRRWAKGAAVSDVQHREATRRMLVYRDWLLSTLFTSEGCQTLIVLPVANAGPNYRDELSPSPESQSALDELFLAPILGAPDIVVPIGEVPYDSKITGKTEFLPVIANIVAAPKRDSELLQAVEKVMAGSGRPTVVATGSRMFPSTKDRTIVLE